jgi:glycosyltransferase involved in cell wall biosynthesis
MNLNFSVLLSVYKKENPFFLEQALQSISDKQSVKPNEIIIIRDGLLTDSLDIILDNFLTKYPNIIKIFGYEKNKGLGYALNYGLNKCSNEIVFRMDTDDICVSDRFEKQLRIFNDHPDLVLVGGLIEEFNNTPGDLKQIRNVPISSSQIETNKFTRSPFSHMTIAFKKSIILESEGYKDMPGYEDHYLWLRVLKKYKGYNIPEILVHARVGNDFIGRRQGITFFKNELFFQNTLLKENLQTSPYYFKHLLVRVLPKLFPKFFLKLIYKFVLRK